MLPGKKENNSRKNEEMEPKQKQHPVVDVTGDGSKVQCCKEQYCIGTWNVRSMNQQGKLEVVKQETARVNIDILGISELKWTAMGEFNSDDQWPRGSTLGPRARAVAERRYPASDVRSSSCALLEQP